MNTQDLGGLGLVISPAARNDLAAIHAFGRKTWGVSASDAYFSTLKSTLWRLTTQSRISKKRPDLTPPTTEPSIRSLFVMRHVIFYRLRAQPNSTDTIEIIRILHARQDPAAQAIT